MLTMFGMVLAIGILVDDAIVVVENVERIMAEEGLPPKEAARKAMSQITSAIIGITLVLMAVFVPMAFFPGSVGIIYRQFSVTVVAAIAFSALMALSLTPALCATLLKPVKAGHGHARKGLFGWFNRALEGVRGRYVSTVGWSLRRTGRLMLIYAVLVGGLVWAFVRLPAGFVPVDDQGFITTDVQTPSDSSHGRTEAAVEAVEKYLAKRPGIADVTFLTGFAYSGQGMNTAQAFITLKDWSERPEKDSAANIVADTNRDLSSLRDAKITALQPPPIDNLGNSSGFSFRLQDRGQKGYEALMQATDQLIAEANASPVLKNVYVEGLPSAPQVNLVIDREKASALGVTFQDINDTMSTNLGSTYVNDFPNRGRMQRVIVQADRDGRTNVRTTSSTTTSRTAAAGWSRSRRSPRSNGRRDRPRSSASTTIRPSASAVRRGRASPPATRSPRWSGWRAVCRAASAMNGPASRCRKSCRDRRRRSCSRSRRWWCSSALPRSMKAGPFRSPCC